MTTELTIMDSDLPLYIETGESMIEIITRSIVHKYVGRLFTNDKSTRKK